MRTKPRNDGNLKLQNPMPELPDITIYLESLDRFIGGRQIERIELRSPFVVRTVDPDLLSLEWEGE